jgi:hypothetical protein
MDNTIRVFSGRTFNPEDIELIKWTRKTYPQLSRKELSSTVCEFLDWKTPAGRVKSTQCADFLNILESEGVITLPPSKYPDRKVGKIKIPKLEVDTTKVIGEARDYDPIVLELVRRGNRMKRWRAYVNQYHMLGDKQAFGSRLQYFIKSRDKELGCLQFSASAWSLEDRDNWIGWNKEDRKARLHLIVNNSRFLIFPWVHIRNLASKALSLAIKQIQDDWLREFCYTPVLLETFVDLENFKGTCYKAANWIYLGETKGRGRMDRNKEYALSQKAIFMFPLQKDFRECLKGDKPYKVVNPDE